MFLKNAIKVGETQINPNLALCPNDHAQNNINKHNENFH